MRVLAVVPDGVAVALPIAGAIIGAALSQALGYRNAKRIKRNEEERQARLDTEAAARLVKAELETDEFFLKLSLDHGKSITAEMSSAERWRATRPLASMPRLRFEAWVQTRLMLARHLPFTDWDPLLVAYRMLSELDALLEPHRLALDRLTEPSPAGGCEPSALPTDEELRQLDELRKVAAATLAEVGHARSQLAWHIDQRVGSTWRAPGRRVERPDGKQPDIDASGRRSTDDVGPNRAG